MQGTQYAPRESILCMEHFVALQCGFHGVVYSTIISYSEKRNSNLSSTLCR